MATTEEILRRIEKGGTLDELAAELDIRKSALGRMSNEWNVPCARARRWAGVGEDVRADGEGYGVYQKQKIFERGAKL